MRSLSLARAQGREWRARIGRQQAGLLDRVVQALGNDHQIEVVGVPAAAIRGSRAELQPADGCIWYDQELDGDPAEKLLILAHELGHLALHPRLYRAESQLDFLSASAYLDVGSGGLTRYSRKTREEAEANAFALEFVCPADALFDEWRAGATASGLAAKLGLPPPLIRMQLAEALAGGEVPQQILRRPEPELDKRQLDAAETVGTAMLIDAGPGTGKTATLVHRIQFLVNERGAPPESILVLTFSNEAAEEIRQRVAGALEEDVAARLQVQTFHGFGVEILRSHGHLLDVPGDAPIIDEVRQLEIIRRVVGGLGGASILDLRDLDSTADRALRHIAYLKDRNISVDDLREACERVSEASSVGAQERQASAEFLELYAHYEETKAAAGLLDFGDLIMGPIRVLKQNPELTAALRQQYRWILVDEYQDVGRSVAQLLKVLGGPENPPWVVGDARQAIYRFRGAAPENVTQFGDDFPGARVVRLESNYRSSPEIVEVANELAEAMVPAPLDTPRSRWKSRSTARSPANPIFVAQAASDVAEHLGVVGVVREWLESGIEPEDVAVLGRRNVDVRNVTLALGAAGIPAVASSVVTSEGAGGDLAAMATLADRAPSSAPRVALALGRGRLKQGVINQAIALARARLLNEESGLIPGEGEPERLANEVTSVARLSREGLHSEDGFEAIGAFLFDRSEYLRRLLDMGETPEGRQALGEIRSCLAMAANYRYTHPHVRPLVSRQAFAAHLRKTVCGGAPAAIPPRTIPGAVRVLTCHAAKGLEFPCVVVTGQTLGASESLAWLPPELQPNPNDHVEQSDSLLFVGVTRAKQRAVISYSLSRSGGRASRRVTPLLDRWRQSAMPPSVQWNEGQGGPDSFMVGAVWGGEMPSTVPARHLKKDRCALKSYLDLALDMYFPEAEAQLYPFFVGRVRKGMRQLASAVLERRSTVDEGAVKATVEEIWPEKSFAKHPYYQIYRPLLIQALTGFVRALGLPADAIPLDVEIEWTMWGAPRRLKFDLVAYYRGADRSLAGVVLHFPSLAAALDKKARGVLWGSLGDSQRIQLALLDRHHEGTFKPYVHSVVDGITRPFLWHRNGRKPVQDLAERAIEKGAGLVEGRFETVVKEYDCDRCDSRICCPLWMGLAS